MKKLLIILFFTSFVFLDCCTLKKINDGLVGNIVRHLENGLDFMDKYYNHINLDGALGLTLAQSELMQIESSNSKISQLLKKSQKVLTKIISRLPKSPRKNELFTNVLLKPNFWNIGVQFERNSLLNLGRYNWSADRILSDKEAVYNGTHSDVCIQELIENCGISDVCQEMMFENRLDYGYLLTHRLLFLQIGIRNVCIERTKLANEIITVYCSLMLKEAKTNEHLGFPQHDIFLEQLVLCGIEGKADFLKTNWLEEVMNWQTVEGCYRNGTESKNMERSTNLIDFGCTDHTTGLGIASLALYLHFLCDN